MSVGVLTTLVNATRPRFTSSRAMLVCLRLALFTSMRGFEPCTSCLLLKLATMISRNRESIPGHVPSYAAPAGSWPLLLFCSAMTYFFAHTRGPLKAAPQVKEHRDSHDRDYPNLQPTHGRFLTVRTSHRPQTKDSSALRTGPNHFWKHLGHHPFAFPQNRFQLPMVQRTSFAEFHQRIRNEPKGRLAAVCRC